MQMNATCARIREVVSNEPSRKNSSKQIKKGNEEFTKST